MRLLLGLLALRVVWSDYYPLKEHTKYFPPPAKPEADCTPQAWSPPKLQPWESLRALTDSITVTWMPGWHPWCEVNHYHLEARQPGKFPLRFADLETLQHREGELDPMSAEWPGDDEWTPWKLVYSGLSRAYTLDVDTSKGHAVQFRVQACGRRIKPGFALSVVDSATSALGRRYEIVKEPHVGMRWHTDRDYTAADLGWFTAARGFVYVRTPMADKNIGSDTVMLTLDCPNACHVYLCYDFQAHWHTNYWFEEEGWTVDYTTPRPYRRTEMMYKYFPAGKVHIRGSDDTDWAHGVPLIFVKEGLCPNPSRYSEIQTTHTVLGASLDKINLIIRASGKNSPDYTEIAINRVTLYKRRDETGLVLAIFSRLDFSLHWLKTYDTHRNRTASLEMSKDIRSFNQSYFIVVASSIAWEWQATRTLAHTMEYCGAFHFGQWVHIFSEQPHYESPKSDLQQTARQDEFGHPYVFVGIPGIGAGHGWESLLHNTGHYIPTKTVLSPRAMIRGIVYYDYVARLYRIQEMKINKADFYIKNKPPVSESIHNPLPASKGSSALHSTMLPPPFSPYVGTLQNHITSLIEANETVPPFNYAFLLYTVAGVMRVDPRPRNLWVTEYERVWSGPSARYWPHNGTMLNPGLLLDQRNCTDFLNWGYQEASPEACGADFTCNDVKQLNDFSSKAAMEAAGWQFSWDNRLTFKPEKNRYDLSGQVPWTAYWGLDNPFDATVTLVLKGKGTMTMSFGNCWEYSLGYVELFVNGVRKEIAYSLEIDKRITMDFKNGDTIEIREYEAVIVINDISISCWGCCQTVDYPNVIATMCNVGVTPTLCRNATKYQLTNFSQGVFGANYYGFNVIDTTKLGTGTR